MKQKDGLEIEFGGEDVAVAMSLWEHRNDAVARPPAATVHIELPEGWVAKTPTNAKIRQWAAYPALTAYFELVAEPKADFDDNTTCWLGPSS